MISRVALALALSCVTASAAFAKDFCFQLNTGAFAGSQLVLKRAKTSKRAFGPVQGYFALYFSGSGTFEFRPIHGSSIVNASGSMVLGIEVPGVGIQGTGGTTGGSGDPTVVNVTCSTGGDGRLDPLDPCSGSASGAFTGHIIPCSEAVQIPS